MRNTPTLPRLLSLTLLLPALGGLAALFGGPELWHQPARSLVQGWSALVLAMVGGSWWGFAAGAPAAERRGGFGWVWFAGLLVTLGALVCLLGPALALFGLEPALVMLGGAHLVSLGADAKLGPLAPRWWLALRLILGVMIGAACFAAALA